MVFAQYFLGTELQFLALDSLMSHAFYQRGLSGQKPKHTPFCMKGATSHTSLHKIGPNLALN
jgi:hypothetical protein